MSAVWRPTTAQMVNPPPPGTDPEYDANIDAWHECITQKAEATEPPPKLYADVPMPKVPEAEQRRLARMMVDGLSGEPDADGEPFPVPEDRARATLSPLGDVEYVEDLIRPGRIVLVAAEESSGKSTAVNGELCIRLAVAGGAFAGTWPVLVNGPVLVLSEMHPDDDYQREEAVLAALGKSRADLAGRYYRLPLYSAANGRPALRVPEWREYIVRWCQRRGVLLAVIDTATGAADVDPWGREIQAVYRDLRAMLAEYPDLAVVLVVHLKKPQGRGERRISDVLGEWGRWCDVVLLMEGDGLERTKLTVRKRVRRERRLVVTKRAGLLVDPQDIEAGGPKVPADKVVEAVAAQPGMTYAELAAVLHVTKPTATSYVRALSDRLMATPTGPKGARRVFLTDKPPNSAKQEGFGGALAVTEGVDGEGPPNRQTAYIDRRLALRSQPTPSLDLPMEPQGSDVES